jgi:hypothetical protein
LGVLAGAVEWYKWLSPERQYMVDITLFEVHLDDSSLTANAPFSRGEKEVEAADEPPESSSSKGTTLAAVVGLVFLAALAFVVRKRVMGGDDEGEQVELADVTS